MNKFLKRLRIGLLGGAYLLWCFFTWILPYSNHPEKYPLSTRYGKARKLVTFILKLLKADLRVENRIELNTEASMFFACNHLSVLDPLFLVALSPKPIRFIAKIETKKLPFAGRILRAMDALFLDRDDPRQAIDIFKQAQLSIEKKEAHVCIFPEGTRNKHPYEKDVKEFHPGSFKIPQRSKMPITPVCVFGTHHLLGNTPLYRHYLVSISFLRQTNAEAVAKMKTVEIADAIHEAVKEKFIALRQEDLDYFASKSYKGKANKWWKDLPR